MGDFGIAKPHGTQRVDAFGAAKRRGQQRTDYQATSNAGRAGTTAGTEVGLRPACTGIGHASGT